MNTITSTQNPMIKEVKKLFSQRKHRDKTGKFVLEGLRLVQDAMAGGAQIETVFVSRDMAQKQKADYILGDAVMKEICDTKTPQGIVAIAQKPVCTLQNILARDGPIVFCDAVADPGNLGTIIRTADAAGASGVIIGQNCADVYSPKTIRCTMSSIFNLPVYIADDNTQTFDVIKQRGTVVYAATLDGAEDCFAQDFRGSCMFVLGNEANGVSDISLTYADKRVKIPMMGKAESLNVAAAGAVLLYEAVRQREQKK